MYEQICLFFLRYFYNFRAKIQAVPVFFLMATGFWLLLLLVHSAHGPNFYFQFKQLKAEREREKRKSHSTAGGIVAGGGDATFYSILYIA
jgi:hypothetical protein